MDWTYPGLSIGLLLLALGLALTCHKLEGKQ